MSTAAALIAAVENAGDDLLPRLVLADWFEERGLSEDAARLRNVEGHVTWFEHTLSTDAHFALIADGGEYVGEELELDWGRTPLTDLGLFALANTYAPRLRFLDLGHALVTDEAVAKLFRRERFPSLSFLVLDHVRVSPWVREEGFRQGVMCYQTYHSTLLCHRCSVVQTSRIGSARRAPRRNRRRRCYDCQSADDTSRQEDELPEQAPDTPRPDRHARLGHPGWSRHRWWGGFQVSQLHKRRLAR